MMGPYFLLSSWMERCGRGPIRLRLPIMGQGFGPGGRLYRRRRRRRRKRRRTRKAATHVVEAQLRDAKSSAMIGFVWESFELNEREVVFVMEV